MKALEVYVNGEKVCTAGIPEGVGMVSVTHLAGVGKTASVMAIRSKDRGEVPDHWEVPELSVGDQVMIRFVETDATDPPNEWPDVAEP